VQLIAQHIYITMKYVGTSGLFFINPYPANVENMVSS